jgi:hypothetical protein
VRPTGREPDIGRVPPIWRERNALSLPLGGTSTGGRNWGANQDKNQWIAQQTGYGGDFGGGGFGAWASQNGVDVAALEQQWYQQGAVPEPYEYPRRRRSQLGREPRQKPVDRAADWVWR